MPDESKGKQSKKAKLTQSAPKKQVNLSRGGKIMVGRDLIAGDQIIHGSRYCAQQMNIANVSTPRQFAERLQKVQSEIAGLKESAELTPSRLRRVEVVEGDKVEVIEEAQKPKPFAERKS